MAFVSGYTVFLPGNWDVPTFLFSYTMIGIVPVLFVFWKVYRRTEVRLPLITMNASLTPGIVAAIKFNIFLRD